ncbi:MAG: fatty acyl-AMP ligase, partial [Rhodobiaceae bacterium]|nr:fatty acyl-AMP ligase [Rhodobiaceae bacterium]
MDVLTARADTCQISVLGRGDRATHYTGSQLLEKAENCLKDWATCLGNGPQVMIAALPFGEAFLFPLLASLIGEGCLVPIAPPRPSDAPGRMRHIVENCGATVVLCTSAHQAAVTAQLCDDEGNQICPVYVVDGPNVPLATFNSAPKIAAPIIQHTSGSTRFPKAVPITSQQIRANCAMLQRLWGVNAETVTVNWLPHYHDMGLMGGILYTLLSGGQSLQMSPFEMIRSPLSWLKAISTYRATFSGGPSLSFLGVSDSCSCRGTCVYFTVHGVTTRVLGAEPLTPRPFGAVPHTVPQQTTRQKMATFTHRLATKNTI